MHKELLNTLEDKISSVIGTIERLRSEVRSLRAERDSLEQQLRGFLERIGGMDSAAQEAASGAASGAKEAVRNEANGSFIAPASKDASRSGESSPAVDSTESLQPEPSVTRAWGRF